MFGSKTCITDNVFVDRGAIHFDFVNCNQGSGSMQADYFNNEGRISCLCRKIDRVFVGGNLDLNHGRILVVHP